MSRSPSGFVYVAVILDAWSRRVVGYAISRSIDARLTLAALNAAIETPQTARRAASTTRIAARNTPLRAYREALATNGLVGSMGRRGNPYDNAKAESFMKTLKVEAVYPMAYETFDDAAKTFRTSSTRSTTSADCIPPSAISARNSSRTNTPGRRSNQPPEPCPARGAHSRERSNLTLVEPS